MLSENWEAFWTTENSNAKLYQQYNDTADQVGFQRVFSVCFHFYFWYTQHSILIMNLKMNWLHLKCHKCHNRSFLKISLNKYHLNIIYNLNLELTNQTIPPWFHFNDVSNPFHRILHFWDATFIEYIHTLLDIDAMRENCCLLTSVVNELEEMALSFCLIQIAHFLWFFPWFFVN